MGVLKYHVPSVPLSLSLSITGRVVDLFPLFLGPIRFSFLKKPLLIFILLLFEFFSSLSYTNFSSPYEAGLLIWAAGFVPNYIEKQTYLILTKQPSSCSSLHQRLV